MDWSLLLEIQTKNLPLKQAFIKTWESFWLLIVRHLNQNEILNKEELQKTMPSSHILYGAMLAQIALSFERAEVWNFFLILMLFFLLAETLLGLPAANFSVRSKRL